MRIEAIVVGPLQVNCYVVAGPGREAVVIDPGADAAEIASFLRRGGLRVAAYALTHGHVDHISALADLHDAFPAPVALHEKDAAWAFLEANALPPFYAAPRRPDAEWRAVADGQRWKDAGVECEVLATPGHSPGGVCYLFPEAGALFSGDTLFAGSIGRTDIPGADARALATSLARLCRLPGRTRVYPGHGPSTTLASERAQNPFLAHQFAPR